MDELYALACEIVEVENVPFWVAMQQARLAWDDLQSDIAVDVRFLPVEPVHVMWSVAPHAALVEA